MPVITILGFKDEADAVKIANEVEGIRSEYKKLESAAETLRKALSLSFDPVAATKYAKALAEVETTMADIETTVAPLGVKLKDTFDDPPNTTNWRRHP